MDHLVPNVSVGLIKYNTPQRRVPQVLSYLCNVWILLQHVGCLSDGDDDERGIEREMQPKGRYKEEASVRVVSCLSVGKERRCNPSRACMVERKKRVNCVFWCSERGRGRESKVMKKRRREKGEGKFTR